MFINHSEKLESGDEKIYKIFRIYFVDDFGVLFSPFCDTKGNADYEYWSRNTFSTEHRFYLHNEHKNTIWRYSIKNSDAT